MEKSETPLMSQYAEVVTNIATTAGNQIREAYMQSLRIEHKNGDVRDEVTSADREVGEWIANELRTQFPTHEIYSEENHGNIETIPTHKYLWTIDPIDGTSNFARRIPLFTTVISLVWLGKPVFSVVHNPITNETFVFAKGEGAWRDGERVRTSLKSEPKDVFAILRPGRNKAVQPWMFKIVESFTEGAVGKVANYGASAYDLSLLASGSVELVIYGSMTTADIAGAIGMVREAGGEVYGTDGVPVEITLTPQSIIAVATPSLFEKLRPLLHLELLPA